MMSRDKPWLKMWTEWLGDAKMDRLSLAEQGAWWRLVSLCHECGHINEKSEVDGALVVAGTPLSLVEILKSLKIAEAPDKAIFNQMLEKMQNAGSLNWDSNTLFVTHYEERQRALTDTKEARRQRQRERRESKKREAEKNLPPEEESKRREAEAEAETHAQTSNAKSVTFELSRCYERYIGLLNPLDADRIREFTQYYESHDGKIAWIEQAFIKAPVNKRRWPYVQAILERYIEEGGPDGRAGKRTEPGREPGAHREDAGEGGKFSGFHAIESGPDQPDDREED
jgi:hypothetical protein